VQIRRLSSEDRYTLVSERHGCQRRMRVECTTEVTSQLCVRVQCSRSRIPGSYISRQHPLSSPGFLSSTLPLQQVHTAALSTSKKPASLSEQLSSALLKERPSKQRDTRLDLLSYYPASLLPIVAVAALIAASTCIRIGTTCKSSWPVPAWKSRLLSVYTGGCSSPPLRHWHECSFPHTHRRAATLDLASPLLPRPRASISSSLFLSTSSSPVRFSGHILCSFSQVRRPSPPSTAHVCLLLH
jgi:hypothetical protein